MAFKFEPVNCCIYCGKTNIVLGAEHIIPFGLGGQLILPKSSCKACGDATGKFEGVVQRTIYGDFRMSRGLQTRHKKERPSHRIIGTIDQHGNTSQKSISVRDYPAPYWVYTFGNCGIYLGTHPDTNVTLGNLKTIHDNTALTAFAAEHNWDRKLQFRYMPNEFMRMIAKIGYSFATAVVGYSGFRPLILGSIMNSEANPSYFVGMNEIQEPSGLNHNHELKLLIQGRLAGTTLLIVHARLFPYAETPTYHAVVGEFVDGTQEQIAINKIIKLKDVQFSRTSGDIIPPFAIGGV